jgi:hypothetical protein
VKVKVGWLHSCSRKIKIEDVFIIYIGKRDKKRLFTFTLHFQLAAVTERRQTAS